MKRPKRSGNDRRDQLTPEEQKARIAAMVAKRKAELARKRAAR